MDLRLKLLKFRYRCGDPCEWTFATKFSSNYECDGVVHSGPDVDHHLVLDRADLAGVAERYAGKLDVWNIPTTFETDLFEQMMPDAVKVAMFREPRARVLSSYRKGPQGPIVEAVTHMRENHPSIPSCGLFGASMVKH